MLVSLGSQDITVLCCPPESVAVLISFSRPSSFFQSFNIGVLWPQASTPFSSSFCSHFISPSAKDLINIHTPIMLKISISGHNTEFQTYKLNWEVHIPTWRCSRHGKLNTFETKVFISSPWIPYLSKLQLYSPTCSIGKFTYPCLLSFSYNPLLIHQLILLSPPSK